LKLGQFVLLFWLGRGYDCGCGGCRGGVGGGGSLWSEMDDYQNLFVKFALKYVMAFTFILHKLFFLFYWFT